MQQQALKLIAKVQKELLSLPYPDSYRISKEIVGFVHSDEKVIVDILNRLRRNEPWEYIKGSCEFKNRNFIVTKNTLIPRIETQELVERVISDIKTTNPSQIIEVGTGSGAIICTIVLEHYSKNIQYIATDISKKALHITNENIKLYKLERKVKVINTNLIEGVTIKGNCIIVANLPYIPTLDYYNLHPSVKNFEPRIALEGGKDGLDKINKLMNQIINSNIKPIGIYLEIDPSQKDRIKRLFKDMLPHMKVQIIKDYQGLNRFIIATYQ